MIRVSNEMIDDERWKFWLHFWMLAGPFLVIYAQFVFNLYLIRRHLDDMIDALPNSRYIYIWGESLRKQGWYGGMILLTKIGGMVMWPKAYIKLGDVDSADIANFPPHLKRLLRIDGVMLIGTATWMLAGYVLSKFK